MGTPEAWAEALKISPKKLKEWSALTPDGMPVLVYVLFEGHIAKDNYLNWACEHYQLPVVSEQYFSKAFDPEVARNLQSGLNHEWKPWIYPVEKWDGVTVVACVEPPTESWGDDVRFVLSDPASLQQSWSYMASSFTDAPQNGAEDDAVAPPPIETDVPTGLSTATQAKPFKLDLGGLDENSPFTAHQAPPQADPSPRDFSLPEIPLPEAPPAVKPSPSAKAPTAKSAPPPELPKLELSSLEPNEARPRAKPLMAVDEEPKSATPVAPDYLNAEIESVFKQLKGLYKHVFIMKCAGQVAKLMKWDSSLDPVNGGKGVQIDLAYPTFFRIVAKTHQAYHGYLVDSPAHREFFKNLKVEQLPGCVTAVPILVERDLIGVIVAIGDETLAKLDHLKKVEAVCETLIQSLPSTWSAAA